MARLTEKDEFRVRKAIENAPNLSNFLSVGRGSQKARTTTAATANAMW
jgi:hypothetical protein